MTSRFLLFFSLLYCFQINAQESTLNATDIEVSSLVRGTLLVAEADSGATTPLFILVGGSGPIDRNGNQSMSKSNSLRYLAEALYSKGISSFRYDKRIVRIMKMGEMDERTISLDDFIGDAKDVLAYFAGDDRFDKRIIFGHSQGSLVGMIAAAEGADAFISMAGAGQEIDDVIVDQLSKQAPGLMDNARKSFDDIRVNGVAQNYSPGLSSIFRPSLQPFLFSWMKYNPAEEIAKLDIPVLILNGDKDLQVQVSEAELLQKAKPDARLRVISNMNHIMKEITGGDMENYKSYNEPGRPIMPELIEVITAFITNL